MVGDVCMYPLLTESTHWIQMCARFSWSDCCACVLSSRFNGLRTVPTKYQGFRARVGPRRKSRFLQGLLEFTKKNWGSHAFFRDKISLESQRKCWHSIFLKKEKKDISLKISVKFTFKYWKANILIKILKLHGKWKQKNHCWWGFNDKIVATALLSSLTAFLWFN